MAVSKSLALDSKLLLSIFKNISNINNVLKDFKCDFSRSSRGICNNVYACDLCVFYMIQISNNVKFLTDTTKDYLNLYINLDIFKYFRDVVSYANDVIDNELPITYIQSVVSSNVVKAIKERWIYCNSKK